MSRPEHLRKKAICPTCNVFKPIKSKDLCQNCWHKVKRKTQPEFFLRTRYTEIKQRCISPNKIQSKYYYGLEYCSQNEFLHRFLNDEHFLKLFKEWNESNYSTKLVPSIDRIDTRRGYTIDNIQFITHSENTLKDQETIPTVVTDLNGSHLGEYSSLNDAVRAFKVQQSNAWQVMNGKRKHTCGLIFKRKAP